jgi:hypothetical protein
MRVTVTELRAILDTALETHVLEAFLADAETWVTLRLVPRGVEEPALSAVQKYLAAHFATARESRVMEGQIGDVRERFQRGPVNEYLALAKSFDPTGLVGQEFGDERRFSFRVGAGYRSEAVQS